MPPYDSDEDFMGGGSDGASSPLDNWESYEDKPIDSLSEKLRNQKLVEEADSIATRNLFSGHTNTVVNKTPDKSIIKKIIVSDPYETIKLTTLKDCEVVAKKLSEKIQQSPAKSPVWFQFIHILLQTCQTKMEYKDVVTLKKKVDAIVKAKEETKREMEYSKKKPNVSNFKNYQDELDIMHGDLSDDDEYM